MEIIASFVYEKISILGIFSIPVYSHDKVRFSDDSLIFFDFQTFQVFIEFHQIKTVIGTIEKSEFDLADFRGTIRGENFSFKRGYRSGGLVRFYEINIKEKTFVIPSKGRWWDFDCSNIGGIQLNFVYPNQVSIRLQNPELKNLAKIISAVYLFESLEV